MRLLEPTPRRLDRLLIRRGSAALLHAEHLGRGPAPTWYRPRSLPVTPGARSGEETDWPRIAALYEALTAIEPTPVVALNRAVAFAMAFGPDRAWNWPTS